MTEFRLHPRLPRPYAAIRWEIVREQDPESARASVGNLLPPEVVWTATGSPRLNVQDLARLRDALLDAVAELPFPNVLSVEQREKFDQNIARVYANETKLFPAEASHVELWSYHALILAPDLALWRYADRPKLNVERFVGVDLTRHVFGRLWWRAYTFTGGHWSDEVGWKLLSGLNESDIDQLQTRRGAYGVDPPIVRALAETYVEVRTLAQREGLSARLLWRDLLKRLLREGAFIGFGALAPHELTNAAETRLRESLTALAAEGPSEDAPTDIRRWSTFDDVSLSHLVVAVTDAVDAAGTLSDEALADAVEAQLGVEVPGKFRSLFVGYAFMAGVKNYVFRDEASSGWRVGLEGAAADGRWGDWTPGKIRAASNGTITDDFIGTVFNGNPNRTVKRTIKACAS